MVHLRGDEAAEGRSLKHVTIREYVRALVDGRPAGTAAPSERDLVLRFGVARMTVRHALDALVAEGVLQRFPGRGTFVAEPRRPTGVLSLTEDLATRGLTAESRTLVAGRDRPDLAVTDTLCLAPGATALHWQRLRVADGRAVCLADTWLPDLALPGLLDALPTSLYDELARRGHRPTRADDLVGAGLADAEQAALLEIAPGDPVLRVIRVGWADDMPVEFTSTVFRADTYNVSLRLHT